MTRIHIATGLALAEVNSRQCILLAASRYANHAEPLWTLPGGRQQPGELLAETVAREFLEETGLIAGVGELAYVSESYDGETHVLNATFRVAIDSATLAPRRPTSGDHVAEVAWMPLEHLAATIGVAVVRDPLLAYLRGDLARRYAGYHDAGITIRWPEGDG